MNWDLALLVLLGSALAAKGGQGSAADFHPNVVTHTATIRLDGPVRKVFPLFTPLGEKHWAPGWDPEILYPTDREVAPGTVFRTSDHGATFWVVTRLDEANSTIAYQNFAPDFTANAITVSCRPLSAQQTDVTVEYRYVGLSEKGNQFIATLDKAAYAAKMAHWTETINHYLRTGKTLPHP